MKKIYLVTLCLGFLIGALLVSLLPKPLEIALVRVDGKYGQGFYGVHTYAKRNGKAWDVFCRVLIGPTNNYYHEPKLIGSSISLDEIIARYSKVAMVKQGEQEWLIVGGTSVMSREALERHR